MDSENRLLETILPLGYTYLKSVTEDEEIEFRIKEVADEEAAKSWLEEFCKCSKTVWRLSRTHPYSGRCNLFRLDLRCNCATDRRVSGARPSRNTDCPAKFQITVRRNIKKSKSKHIDPLNIDWPTICRIKNVHNHITKDDHVSEVESDTDILNSVSSEDDKRSSAIIVRVGKEDNDLSTSTNTNPENEKIFITPESSRSSEYFYHLGAVEQFSDVEIDGGETTYAANEIVQHVSSSFKNKRVNLFKNDLTEDELLAFDALICRIKNAYKHSPDLFAPAIRKMIDVSQTLTEGGLLSAMHNFGFTKGKKRVLNASNKVKRPYQPRNLKSKMKPPIIKQTSATHYRKILPKLSVPKINYTFENCMLSSNINPCNDLEGLETP